MASIPEVVQALQTVLTTVADQAGRASDFILWLRQYVDYEGTMAARLWHSTCWPIPRCKAEGSDDARYPTVVSCQA
jgi:hypothetical protein